MGKAVTRGQALELVGQFSRDTNWGAISSEGAQKIIDLKPEERAARFTAFINAGARATVLTSFVSWRLFRIGGVEKEVLLKRLKARFVITDSAEDLINSPRFTTGAVEESIDTIVLTPAEFGYDGMPTTAELFDPNRLREWSDKNVERLNGRVVELLPSEAGPHIRLQYRNQASGTLYTAMNPIDDRDGFPLYFNLGVDDCGVRILRTVWRFASDRWYLDDRIVFRIRKIRK